MLIAWSRSPPGSCSRERTHERLAHSQHRDLPAAGWRGGHHLLARGSAATIASNARWIALVTTIVEFAVSLVIWAKFDGHTAAFQFEETAAWLAPGIGYHLGVDGISMLFVVLTAGLMPFCILASWNRSRTASPNT
ncbi:MAG: hypothetical protein WDM81_20750 [Rhizomicrobium sp.]